MPTTTTELLWHQRYFKNHVTNKNAVDGPSSKFYRALLAKTARHYDSVNFPVDDWLAHQLVCRAILKYLARVKGVPIVEGVSNDAWVELEHFIENFGPSIDRDTLFVIMNGLETKELKDDTKCSVFERQYERFVERDPFWFESTISPSTRAIHNDLIGFNHLPSIQANCINSLLKFVAKVFVEYQNSQELQA